MVTISLHAASSIIPKVKQYIVYVKHDYVFVYYVIITGGHSVGVSEFTINMPESISIQ